jgi:hypothetical protein
MTDTQNVSRQTLPAGTDGGMARRTLVLPEGLPWTTPAALHHIAEERVRQIGQGYTPEHDDAHTPTFWIGLIGKYLDDADHAVVPGFGREDMSNIAGYRAALLRAAATATAALEAFDRRAAAVADKAQPPAADNSDTRPSDTEPPEAA